MMIEQLTFYDYFRSSASYRVRIALALKGLSAEQIKAVDLRGGEQSGQPYKSLMPSGLVPSFTFGGKTFGQSIALIEWLDALYPTPRLIPTDPYEALAVREMALTVACDIHPLNNLRVLNYLTGPLKLREEDRLAWYRHWITIGFATLEALIAKHERNGPYCFGEAISLADVCLAPQVYNARRFDVDMAAYPALCRVDAHCNTLPGFQSASPEAQNA
ncbi:MAG: maleylacetoacetate isomerase [Hyphomicrobiales bacterium]